MTRFGVTRAETQQPAHLYGCSTGSSWLRDSEARLRVTMMRGTGHCANQLTIEADALTLEPPQ
jgi:hypothetical protein